MPRASEVKVGIAVAAQKQLYSVVRPMASPWRDYMSGKMVANESDETTGLTVTFAGKTAYCTKAEAISVKNGGRLVSAAINYPFIDDRAILTRSEADLFSGYTLHEVGHLLYTDFSLNRNYPVKPEIFAIWNGLEDPRIETAMIQGGVGGARICFEQLLSKLLVDAGKTFNPCLPEQVPFALAVLGRCRLWGFEHPLLRNVYKRMPANIAAFYQFAMDELAGAPLDLSGTEYTMDLAKKLFSMLPNGRPQQQPQQPQQPSDEKSEGEEGDGSDYEPGDDYEGGDDGDKSGSADEGDEADSDDEGDDGAESGSDDEGDDSEAADGDDEGDDGESADGDDDGDEGSESGDDGESADGDDGDEGDDEGDAAGEVKQFGSDGWNNPLDPEKIKSPEVDIEALTKRINKRNRKMGEDVATSAILPGSVTITDPVTEAKSRWGMRRDPESGEWTDRLGNKLLAPERANRNGSLLSAIASLLISPEMVGWDDGFSSGRFNRRSVSRLLSGAENVFERRWESEGIDTAVSVLVDCSGSMSCGIKSGYEQFAGHKTEQSREDASTAVVGTLAEAFHRAGIEFSISGFSGGYGGNGAIDKLSRQGRMDGEVGGIRGIKQASGASIFPFKPFGKKLPACREAMSVMNHMASGGTPDYTAVSHIGNELMARPEKRKILFVITDGWGNPDLVKTRCESLTKSNIDVIGIGIGHDVSEIYPTAVTVRSIEDLSVAAMKTIRDSLAKGQANRRTM